MIQIFGKCNNPNYHGHNYELIVSLIGTLIPQTGYVFDLKVLSDLIKENVLVNLTIKTLILDTPYFKNLNPTAENIAVIIWRILRQQIDNLNLKSPSMRQKEISLNIRPIKPLDDDLRMITWLTSMETPLRPDAFASAMMRRLNELKSIFAKS